ncbi:MAG: beta-1,6-N-acetylglucosaminyltransferase [Verrucomicrobiota bacterium]
MKIGFILLAHNEPAAIRRLVDILAGAGHSVAIHFDASSPAEEREAVSLLEMSYPGLVRVTSKIHCKWGEWSLVEATLLMLRIFEKMPDKPDFIHLMSGADFPIRPIADMQEFLRRHPDQDYVESYDITKKCWVKGGLSMERFQFFFPVNFRSSRKTFNRLVGLQRTFGIRRKIPLALTPHMGSQWWTLRWSTCQKILEFIDKNPRVVRYFRSTWIPDESFFPTLIGYLIPRSEISNIQLLLHHFTPIGRPYIIYQDHIPLVCKIPHFFIRKVTPSAREAVWEAARHRKSPIPHPRDLARVHHLLSTAIDKNYELTDSMPGYIGASDS